MEAAFHLVESVDHSDVFEPHNSRHKFWQIFPSGAKLMDQVNEVFSIGTDSVTGNDTVLLQYSICSKKVRQVCIQPGALISSKRIDRDSHPPGSMDLDDVEKVFLFPVPDSSQLASESLMCIWFPRALC